MLNNLLNSPALLQSIADCAMGYSESFRPAADAKGYIAMCKHDRSLAIVRLFLRSCPTAVRRPTVSHTLFAVAARIVAFSVNTIYRMNIVWLFPHIVQEVEERLSPPFTNRYSIASIHFVAVLAWVIASSMHLPPGSIFGCHLALASISASTCTMAATGHLVTAPKYRSADHNGLAALAATYPVQFPPFIFRTEFHDRQFAVNAPGFIRGIYASARPGYSRPKIPSEQLGLCAALTSTVPPCATFASSSTENSPFPIDVPSLVFHPGINPQRAAFTASRATARRKIVACDEIGGTAVAQDTPVNDLAASLAKICHYETAKSLPSKIFEIVGASDRITRRHVQLLVSWIMVRAKSVHNNCLGSFHFIVT